MFPKQSLFLLTYNVALLFYLTLLQDRFDDFVDALTRVSLPHEFIPPQSKANYYFISQDHSPFYLGDPYMKDGHKYGLGNIALFFANGLDLAIEHDSCDEHNVHPLAFKLPLSNSCGSRGVSFQDMVCDSSYDNDLPDMSCEVDYNMALEAVTSEAAPPFQCAPASQIPFTGYWDLENNVVVADEAYANDNGMVNVEGKLQNYPKSPLVVFGSFVRICLPFCFTFDILTLDNSESIVMLCCIQDAVGGDGEFYTLKEFVPMVG